MRVLVLGGTSEASALAVAMAAAGVDAVFSYAGRTEAPAAQPLPQRIGGFGGIDGLVSYLRGEGITRVIDATHPFATGMSRNAMAACAEAAVPLLALQRMPWVPETGDRWHSVPDREAAVRALPDQPCRVFLAIGRQHLEDFAAKSQHHYLLRLVDAPATGLPLPDTEVVVARGPFTLQGDLDLLCSAAIDIVVAKNAGGTGAEAKLAAARALGLPVIMIDRPALPHRLCVRSVPEVMEWLAHPANLGV